MTSTDRPPNPDPSPSDLSTEASATVDGADVVGQALPIGYGPWTATFVVVASMVGTGVLTTSGFSIYAVGSNAWVLGLWVLGGLLALCGALVLAELATMFPRSGGDYVYLREAYGPLPAFLSGWVSFLIGFGGPIAVAGSAAAFYLLRPLGYQEGDLVTNLVASAAIVAFAIIHSAGANRTILAQSAFTILKVAILGLLATIGIAASGGSGWDHLDDLQPLDGDLALNMGLSLVFISYAYTGWNGVGYVAGEVRDPQRSLPRAILLGTGFVTLLYLALNLMYMLALSASDIEAIVDEATPEDAEGPRVDAVAPIAEIAARRLLGPRVSGVLSVAIGLSMLASLSAFVLTGPRVAYAMARRGQFPAIAARLRPKSQTPAVATAMQVTWSLILLWSGRFNQILIFSGVGLALFTMLTISSIYVLRIRRPDLTRPFRTPGYPLTPAVFLILTGLLTSAAFLREPEPSTYALIGILVGIPIYYFSGLGSSNRQAEKADPQDISGS